MKEISILLTKYDDVVSNIIFLFCGLKFTHTSIALEDNPKEFYSFNKRGFAIETLEKHKSRGVKHSCCYKIKVKKESYYKIKKLIDDFKENKEQYSYDTLGVIMCILKIPHSRKEKGKYFCSHFVAEVLNKSKAINMPTKACLTKPNHFTHFLESHPFSFKIENIV